jgi:ankyrin repeat protein
MYVTVVQAERLPARHVPFPEVRRDAVQIRLTRSSCFGSCPSYAVTISGDGSVLFVGEGSVNVEGEHRYAIPVERVDALIRQFRDGDFWSLDDHYEVPVTDQATYTLTFSAGGVTKTVTDYVGRGGGMPRIVTALEEAVDEAADSARWITGNEHTLAALEAERFNFRSLRAAHMFHAVVREGSDALALALLDRGAPIDLPSNCPSCVGGRTVRLQALFEATARGRIAIFDRLNTDAAFAALTQPARNRLLMMAARTRSPHLVTRLLARGARATATDRELGSALIQALEDAYDRVAPDADQGTVVRLLLARGAPLEARDGIDWTALQSAYDDDPAMVRLLLERGARVDAAVGDDQPLLYLTDDEEIALLALAAGANRNLTSEQGETLSQIARRNRWTRVEQLLTGSP